VLERALEAPATRRLAARAAVLRKVALDDSVGGLESALEALLASPAAADRAVGAWGIAVLDARRGSELIGSADLVKVRAAARAALPGTEIALAAADRLGREADPTTRTALAIALADPTARERVPTSVLTRLIEKGGVEAPLAALGLATRDDPDERPQIQALLAGGDAVLRAHVALGLASSSEPSAVGALENAYRFEADSSVRHAIVSALSQRSERTRLRTLRLAAYLDNDRATREAAVLALKGARLGTGFGAGGTVWLILSAPDTSGSSAPTWSVLIRLPGGLALPVAADPDGLVTLARLPRGAVGVRIARAGP
jgi:hypothetical protein